MTIFCNERFVKERGFVLSNERHHTIFTDLFENQEPSFFHLKEIFQVFSLTYTNLLWHH